MDEDLCEELPEPRNIREIVSELRIAHAEATVEFVAGQMGLPESRVRELSQQFDLGRRVDRTHRVVFAEDFEGLDLYA